MAPPTQQDRGAAAPRKITLARKSQSELKQASTQGRARTINVEVRQKRTYIKRDVLEEQSKQTQGVADAKRQGDRGRRSAPSARNRKPRARKASAWRRRTAGASRTKPRRRSRPKKPRRAAGRSSAPSRRPKRSARRGGSRRRPRGPSGTSPRRRPWPWSNRPRTRVTDARSCTSPAACRRAQQEEEARQGTHRLGSVSVESAHAFEKPTAPDHARGRRSARRSRRQRTRAEDGGQGHRSHQDHA